MKRTFDTDVRIINGDWINATVAAIIIITMIIVNTIVRIAMTTVGIVGISLCDHQIITAALG